MKTFLEYILEANANGSKFEELVEKNVLNWISLNKLGKRFSAKRYLKISEDLGLRDEDYSDIIVKDRLTNSTFFIECKKTERDNILNALFDIDENCHLIPVKTTARTESKSPYLKKMANDIELTQEWHQFAEFLRLKTKKYTMIDLLLEKLQIDDKFLFEAIRQYNTLIDKGYMLSNCQKFNKKVIRPTTKNTLFVALQWRISDTTHTWDVCHLKDIKYFGKMIFNHYMYGKAGVVKYILVGDSCYKFEDDDPLKTTCKLYPIKNITGQFDLKFSPRFGSGSMYLTPRSHTNHIEPSNFTFVKGK